MPDPLTCAVAPCRDAGETKVSVSGSESLLCAAHGEIASAAVDEVMSHLLETGYTYLPSTGTTVLVEYAIRPTDVDEATFRAWRGHLDPQKTPGLIGETLYGATFDGDKKAYRRFVNLGHWASRKAFDDHFKTSRGAPPRYKRFEAKRRRRSWLTRDPDADSGTSA